MAIDVLSASPAHSSAEAIHHSAQVPSRSPLLRGRITPFLVGSVLTFAAIGKTHQLWTEGVSQPALLSWGLLGLSELEIALACCLVAGVWPRLVRGIALLLFAAFTGVALSKAAAGAHSCACAGNLVDISPLIAVGADLLILAGLWWWQPVAAFRFTWLKTALSVAFMVLAAWPLVATFQPVPFPRLVATPVVDLGELAQAERRSFLIQLRNPHDRPVEIVGLDSHCPCLETQPEATVVAARQSRSVSVTLDLSREPDFTGPLSLTLTGRAANGAGAFSTRVETTVRRAHVPTRLTDP